VIATTGLFATADLINRAGAGWAAL